MRKLEQAVAAVQATARRAASRRVRTDAGQVQPARLVIRLDDADLPGVLGEGELLQLGDWRKLISGAVEWLGPVDVTVLATHSGDHGSLPEVIRFAHRLECHTLLVTDGTGIDLHRAEELIDRGLNRVRVLVGGVSDDIQRSVVGNSAVEATEAVRALVEARRDREADLDIEVVVPWRGRADEEVRAVLGWARQVGANGFRVMPPWKADQLPADPELLDALLAEERPFNRSERAAISELHAMVAHQDGLPGLARRSGPVRRRRFRCPVGGQRVEVTALGQVCSCPFQPAIGTLEGRLEQVWANAGRHLEAISACDRACAHPELAPARVLPRVGAAR